MSSEAELKAAGNKKLTSKNLDLIYVNDVSNGKIFGSDQTSGLIMDASGGVAQVPSISKDTLSEILLDQLLIKLG